MATTPTGRTIESEGTKVSGYKIMKIVKYLGLGVLSGPFSLGASF